MTPDTRLNLADPSSGSIVWNASQGCPEVTVCPGSRVRCDSAVIELIRNHLLANARRYFPQLQGLLTVSSEVVTPSSHPITRFVIFDGVRTVRVVAKWTLVYPENNEGHSEFLNYLQFTSLYGSNGHFRCPKALDFLPKSNVLLTEHHPGIRLLHLLWPTASLLPHRPPNIDYAIKEAAKWLKAFHAMVPAREVALDVGWAEIEDASLWLWNGFVQRDAFRALVGNALANQVVSVRDLIWQKRSVLRCVVGPYHRDFGPGNILINEKLVVILDAESRADGPQIRDVASFITNLALSSALRFRSENWYESRVWAFLTEYYGTPAMSDNDAIVAGLFELSAALTSIGRQISKLPITPAPLGLLARSHVRRVCQNVLGNITRKVLCRLGGTSYR